MEIPSNPNFKEKYIKYKSKYKNLKNPQKSIVELINRVEINFNSELESMRSMICLDDKDPTFVQLKTTFDKCIRRIKENNQQGKINPFVKIVTNSENQELKDIYQGGGNSNDNRLMKIGYFPTAADPLHYAHLLTAFEILAESELDKIVFIVGGEDKRKPNLTPYAIRKPMALRALNIFKDFFAFSDIANLGNNFQNDGELNMFLDLKRNINKKITASYIVGSDHFNYTIEKDGVEQDDTLKKLSDNVNKFASELPNHTINAIFIARNEGEITDEKLKIAREQIKNRYPINVIVPSLSFSSTALRDGFAMKYLIMIPTVTFDDVKQNKLYGTKCFLE